MKKFILLFVIVICFTISISAQDGSGVDIGGILTTVFGILMTLFGGVAAWFKRKSNKLANFGLQAMELTVKANDLLQHHKKAIEDDKLTREELLGYKDKAIGVAKEAGDVTQAFKALFKKDLP